MLLRSFGELLARVVVIALLLGGVWLVLQFYTEEELIGAAEDFWAWWSTLLSGELATYWNPIGAGIALGAAVLFVVQPIRRLFRTRGRGSHYDDHHHDDGLFDSDDGGGGDDD
jgi:hypothetical protein